MVTRALEAGVPSRDAEPNARNKTKPATGAVVETGNLMMLSSHR